MYIGITRKEKNNEGKKKEKKIEENRKIEGVEEWKNCIVAYIRYKKLNH